MKELANHYRFERRRRCSLPHEFPISFSVAGFYHFRLHFRNEVRTFCCDKPFHLNSEDDPFREHAVHSPNCWFIRLKVGEENIRQWLAREGECCLDFSGDDILEIKRDLNVDVRTPTKVESSDCIAFRHQHSFDKVPSSILVDGVDTRMAVNPYFADSDRRKQSCLENGAQYDPTETSYAGFYADGSQLVCFQCDVCLRDVDPNHDLCMLHALHSPCCLYINMLKGEDFVKQVNDSNEMDPSSPTSDRESDIEEVYSRVDLKIPLSKRKPQLTGDRPQNRLPRQDDSARDVFLCCKVQYCRACSYKRSGSCPRCGHTPLNQGNTLPLDQIQQEMTSHTVRF